MGILGARGRRRACAWLGAAAAALLAGPAAPSALAGETVFTAQFVCNDRGAVYPLPNARVELWRRGLDALPKWVTDTRLAVVHTDRDGRVALRVRGPEDDFYLRIQLSTDGVRAEDWWAPWAWFADTPTNQNDVPVQDLRAQQLGDGRIPPECAAFEGVRRAYDDYRAVIGERPPAGHVLVNLNSPSAGVPFAPWVRIQWPPRHPPGREPGTFETTSHEFAHTVRHGFDGGLGHFFLDVARFGYLQQHGPCKRTTEGFAFNEGWAAYWARDYAPAPKCPGVRADDYAVEGNVAAALTALERYCEGVDRARMVDVLRRNPRRIHTFEEFRRALGCRPFQTSVDAGLAGQRGLTRGALLRFGRAQLAALDGVVAGGRRRLRLAERAARRPLPCPPRPCVRALERAVLPPLLRAEIDQARLLRRTLAVQASSAGLRRLGRPESRRFSRRLAARAAAFRRGSSAIARRGLREALAAARPVLRRDRGPAVAATARGLRRALAATARGGLPAGFALATPGAAPVVTRAALPAPPPDPPPPPPPPPPQDPPPPPPEDPPPPPPPPPEDPPPPPPPAPRPDLVVDAVYAFFNEGVGWEVRADVRNAGPGGAPATRTGITPHGEAERLVDTPALAPGETATVSTPCTYGTPSASARADATGAVDEDDETNNTRASEPSIFCRFP